MKMNSLEGGYAVAINFGKRFGLGGLRLPISDPNEQRSIDYQKWLWAKHW